MDEIRNQLKTMNRQFGFYMDQTASMLPEYSVVMATDGVGPTLGPQLMAEIGDVTRFTHRGVLTAFAGVDPGANQSGGYEQKSVRTCIYALLQRFIYLTAFFNFSLLCFQFCLITFDGTICHRISRPSGITASKGTQQKIY